MSDSVIVALIGVAGSIVVGILSYAANRRGAREASETNAKLLDYRLKRLEEKQDKHNDLIERMYKVEGQVTEIIHDLRDLKGAIRP